MKLLNYTSRYLAFLLLLLISVWAILFYYAMLEEIYDSLDDGLENQKFLMVERAAEDPSILSQDDPEFKKHIYNFTPISKENYQNFKESYRDTLMYMLNEKDFEPVRVYESAAIYGDEYYKLKIITSMVEEDDLVHDLAAYIIGLYLILLASILFLNNLLLKRIWKPFYFLIEQLRKFKIEKGESIVIQESPIEEFNLLNSTVEKLTQKSTNTYIAQKQFIENASHELQTPLAISINKLELLLEKNDLTESHSQDIATVLDNLERLTRLNKSLLLLSKIENKQFEFEEVVSFAELTKHIVADFEDLAEHREMKIMIASNQELKFQINEDLAIVLLINLIKNSLIHGKKGELIKIDILPDRWHISNLGDPKSLDETSLFERFAKAGSNKRSTGLGLAIAKAIADRYSINLSYNFKGAHIFVLQFPKT
ncbi:signal transduction histidine kinase [Gillisia mitskevichiae]|uniref:histidine kinase n=1 Tax=Gillisia mitskevichiae TaxID=270921 RepID=A0A495PUE5_9FLAO|nr:HAMP domain-containing sensor histidine kinase [Gillisia mitskevichiae]RKS53385.1 signal transduction histidine kinase [Gillisia mitskevichiae]